MVDDQEPRRRFVSSTLEINARLQVTGEGQYGAAAVQPAEKSNPTSLCWMSGRQRRQVRFVVTTSDEHGSNPFGTTNSVLARRRRNSAARPRLTLHRCDA